MQHRKLLNEMHLWHMENIGRALLQILLRRSSIVLNCQPSWLKLSAKIEEKESAEKRTRTLNLKFSERNDEEDELLHFYCCCECCCCRRWRWEVVAGAKIIAIRIGREPLHACQSSAINPLPSALPARSRTVWLAAKIAHASVVNTFLGSLQQWRASCSFCINNYLTNN